MFRIFRKVYSDLQSAVVNMFRIFRTMTLFHGKAFTLGHLKREEEGPKPVATANVQNCSHYHVDKEARSPWFRFEHPCVKFAHQRNNREASQSQQLSR